MAIEGSGVETSNGGRNANATSGGYLDHGWQMVTNPKKQRRLEVAKAKGGKDGNNGSSKSTSDSKIFQALEIEAEERRARRDARIAAALAAGVEDEEDSDDGEAPKTEGTVEETELKKPKAKKPKKPKVSVAEAAAAIDSTDLATFLSDISESFASLPDIQLLRCADYFGRAFSSVTTAQFGWNKILRETPIVKSLEIPLCYVPDTLNKMLADWLSQRPADALCKFIVWILKEILDDAHAHAGSHKSSKHSAPPSQKTKVGVLILLAIILRRRPDILQQQAQTVRNQFQALDQLPTLVWAYGQAAQGDLVIGMSLWVHNLLPLAVGKSSTPVLRDTALQFLESVVLVDPKKARSVLLNGVSRKGERLVPAASLDSVMRASFPTESARTKAADRFQAVYPIVKELALAGLQNSKTTRPVAQQLLPLSVAALSQDVEALSQEACSNFIWCLSQNSDCYQQWEKLHLENLKASNRVLSYIRHEWKEASQRLAPFMNLKKTVKALRLKHKHVLEDTQKNHDLLGQAKVADGHCKAILNRLSTFPSCASATLTLSAGAAIAYAFYMLSPDANPLKWDGWLHLSNIRSLF
ncbi:uncharacterized protein [Physcomitrium patens]|uniref:Uncharacterized protein n=1 Tax=Physcomitrium patens TaxID=3218 RepID=A9S242_PHYPA|nr:transmembrane protein 214-A-like [Physcomitrium patens]XP_024381024.1 transmembrane protein 214-A-like [Physcomitrium patens]PNR50893.1 hypothetical protein PHYPA_010079 [Physcomitrium patens]|eukprot:XP_024381023.1 transmembrane protein 214-A-like [Physcomitrella patens]